MSDKVCVVTGVGPGTGAALARRFTAGGFRVALLACSADRLAELASTIPGSRPYAADVGDPASVQQAFARIRDIPITRAMFSDRPDDFFLRPDAIAETFWLLAQQDRSAWTFEMDVRPFGETW